MSKYIIWVYRIPNDLVLRNEGVLRNAKPCQRCCKGLQDLGFRKLGFSNENGDTELIDLRYFTNDHISAAQKKTTKYSKL